MAVLRPYPFGGLVRRALRELDEQQSLFDLPVARGFLGDATIDLSVPIHGRRASTPYGPAAGPQSQLAQNIALSWLGGARVIELKTVQVDDRLAIARPCIDMQTVGYNVEWSQELTLEESLTEYVKASMLIDILVASGRLPLVPGFDRTVFDMSVGYDLAGITSGTVQAFIHGLVNATPIVDRLRREIPDAYREFRDVPFRTRISDSLTLSTFHGCPPDEIERMVDHLLGVNGLHCVVKLNPTLLGAGETRRLLHDVLGYTELRVPDTAFARDTTWSQMRDFVGRLGDTARALGRGFGVKFTNTLIVENHRDFFPATEREMYLSGQPLHVLAMQLVARFRNEFADRVPVSFSAGIDRHNFADAVSLGLVPVTVCSDLLKTRGYARAQGYFSSLLERMRACGAATIDEFVVASAHANGADGLPAGAPDERVSAALLANTAAYAARVAGDARYTREGTRAVPRKIGRHLQLFDCITCDKCVPVCPNDANFTFALPKLSLPIERVAWNGTGWTVVGTGTLQVTEKHQIGNYADFCNDCGNCDVFCPEDGGPYVIKPRVFGSYSAWRDDAPRDGFYVAGTLASCEIHGRFGGREYVLVTHRDRIGYRGDGFDVAFERDRCLETLQGEARADVDLTYARIMDWLRVALLDARAVTYITCRDDAVTVTPRADRRHEGRGEPDEPSGIERETPQ